MKTVIHNAGSLDVSLDAVREMACRGLEWAKEALLEYRQEVERGIQYYTDDALAHPERTEKLQENIQRCTEYYQDRSVFVLDEHVRSEPIFLTVAEEMGRAFMPKKAQDFNGYLKIVEIPDGFSFRIVETEDGCEWVSLFDKDENVEGDPHVIYNRRVKVNVQRF